MDKNNRIYLGDIDIRLENMTWRSNKSKDQIRDERIEDMLNDNPDRNKHTISSEDYIKGYLKMLKTK